MEDVFDQENQEAKDRFIIKKFKECLPVDYVAESDESSCHGSDKDKEDDGKTGNCLTRDGKHIVVKANIDMMSRTVP